MSYPTTLPDDPYWQEDLTEALGNHKNFNEPDDSINYVDYHYVGAHNAFAYNRFFKTVRQQDQTIIGLLTFGVRGLMLDTYNWSARQDLLGTMKRRGTGDVVLSHPNLGSDSQTQKGHSSYQTLKYELRRVVEFMKENPKSIITIFLEDYADGIKTANEIKEVITDAGYPNPDDLILRPQDLKFVGFPVLGKMRAQNRRLVIFTQHAPNTDVTFSQFDYCYENGYGTSDEAELCKERPESAAKSNMSRWLVVFNHFPGSGQGSGVTPTVEMQKWRVQYGTAHDIIEKAQAQGFAKGRLPNGYWADRVIDCINELKEDGNLTIFDYVNELHAPSSVLVEADKRCYFRLAHTKRRMLANCHHIAGGEYYGQCEGDTCRHLLEYVSTPSTDKPHFKGGEHVYIKTAQDDMNGYLYLNAENWKNLIYENNKGSDEEWVIERIDETIPGFIHKGERVRFRSVRQTSDNEGKHRYLSAESDGYLATRSISDKAAENLGIEWILED